mgnify:CR=1 FL=1
MGIAEALFDRLSGVAAITAIVGTDPVGIYPDQAPPKPGSRHIVMEIDEDDPQHAMGADHEDRRAGVRLYCYGATRDEAQALADEVIDALRRYSGTHDTTVIDDCYSQGHRAIVEDDLKPVVRLVQFDVAYH